MVTTHSNNNFFRNTKLFEGVPEEVYRQVLNALLALRSQHRGYRDDELLMLMLCQQRTGVDRVAAKDYAKKLDELTAENENKQTALDKLCAHIDSIFKDYQIEGDTTLRDVCERITTVCARLTAENASLKTEGEKREAHARENARLFHEYMVEGDTSLRDVCERLAREKAEALTVSGSLRDACARLTSANAEFSKQAQRAKRLIEAAQRWEREGHTSLRLIGVIRMYNVEAGLTNELLPCPHGNPFHIYCPSCEDFGKGDYEKIATKEREEEHLLIAEDRIISAVERAMCKVSGPAQAALLALAVELRRGRLG